MLLRSLCGCDAAIFAFHYFIIILYVVSSLMFLHGPLSCCEICCRRSESYPVLPHVNSCGHVPSVLLTCHSSVYLQPSTEWLTCATLPQALSCACSALSYKKFRTTALMCTVYLQQLDVHPMYCCGIWLCDSTHDKSLAFRIPIRCLVLTDAVQVNGTGLSLFYSTKTFVQAVHQYKFFAKCYQC